MRSRTMRISFYSSGKSRVTACDQVWQRQTADECGELRHWWGGDSASDRRLYPAMCSFATIARETRVETVFNDAPFP